MASHFDRSAEDLGNIVALEHVNVLVPDQGLATLFYVSGLGLTRDPYMMTSTDNMWVNVGRSQFHLPTGKPQKLRGKIGLVIPDRELLLQRLERMKKPLAGTQVRLQGAQRLCRGDLPVGQHLPPARPDGWRRARHGLCRVRRAGRHRQGHRRLLRARCSTP